MYSILIKKIYISNREADTPIKWAGLVIKATATRQTKRQRQSVITGNCMCVCVCVCAACAKLVDALNLSDNYAQREGGGKMATQAFALVLQLNFN